MYNIAILNPNWMTFKNKHSSYRIIHYKDCEEGIAAISLFGNLIDTVVIFETCSFLKADEIKYLIQKQYPKLPILTNLSTTTLADLISSDFFESILTNYKKNKSIDIS